MGLQLSAAGGREKLESGKKHIVGFVGLFVGFVEEEK